MVRALESAWDGKRVKPASGFTRHFVHPGHPVHTVDGLVTGLYLVRNPEKLSRMERETALTR